MIIIYTPCKDEDEAKKIAKHLLDKKLIACANIIKSASIYEWEGKLNDTEEAIALFKTTEDKWEEVKKAIEDIHSYKVPCILKINAESSKEFDNWIKESVS